MDPHHLDGNRKNNPTSNLIGLCPNHHKMIHNFQYKYEILLKLKEKGFNIPKDELEKAKYDYEFFNNKK